MKGIFACGLLALIVAACGGAAGPPVPEAPGGTDRPRPDVPTQPGQPAGSIDSCALTLLSDEEIEAATGQVVTERRQSTLTQVFPSVCDIRLEGGNLTLGVKSSGGREMYECCFEPLIGENDLDEEAVSGLGDKAIRSGESLMVLEDDVVFDLHYFGAHPDALAVVTYLAERILAKLPCLPVGCPGMTVPPPPPTAEAIDVCALLTADEIEKATGLAMLSSESALRPGIDAGCEWTLDTEWPGAHYIQLMIKETGGRAEFDFLANDMFETPPEHVPGIGDDAIKTGSIPAGAVHAVVGDRLISLQFSLPLSVEDHYELVVPLIEIALSRLR